MDFQRLELKVLLEEIHSLGFLINALHRSDNSGEIGVSISTLLGFISEESKNYLVARNLLPKDAKLAASFQESVTKLRTLLKFFDDKKGGRVALGETFSLFQRKGTQMMNANKSKINRFLGKYLQPDLGIYFLDDSPIYLSIASFSAMGLTLQQVEGLKDEDFSEISKKSYEFGHTIGEYVGNLVAILSSIGVTSGFNPYRVPHNTLHITHNDFFFCTYLPRSCKAGRVEASSRCNYFALYIKSSKHSPVTFTKNFT